MPVHVFSLLANESVGRCVIRHKVRNFIEAVIIHDDRRGHCFHHDRVRDAAHGLWADRAEFRVPATARWVPLPI